jgi:hypothetical protein
LRIVAKLIGALVIVAGSLYATLAALDYVWGPFCPRGMVTELKRPYDKFSIRGFGYTKELPKDLPGDLPVVAMRSTLMVCENNNLLGPMRAPHIEVAKDGRPLFTLGVHTHILHQRQFRPQHKRAELLGCTTSLTLPYAALEINYRAEATNSSRNAPRARANVFAVISGLLPRRRRQAE